jgi:hypothetical protein
VMELRAVEDLRLIVIKRTIERDPHLTVSVQKNDKSIKKFRGVKD